MKTTFSILTKVFEVVISPSWICCLSREKCILFTHWFFSFQIIVFNMLLMSLEKKKRERNIYKRKMGRLLPACPLLWMKPDTKAYALTGNRTSALLVPGTKLNHLSHTSQDSQLFFTVELWGGDDWQVRIFFSFKFCVWNPNSFSQRKIRPSACLQSTLNGSYFLPV